jgi:hypothetical protein
MKGGIIGIVGLQGVGKTSALLWLDAIEKVPRERYEVILFRWRREKDLFDSLLNGSHEASSDFLIEYETRLKELLGESVESVQSLPVSGVVEGRLGRLQAERLPKRAWLDFLRRRKVILIDMPDYSKTDRRAMARDLDDIYRLWNSLARMSDDRPNLVIAIQKEMFRGHFFLDKMEKIEIQPLEPRRMLEAYMARFKTTEPFTEDALLTLARMSRGIFRRFLRYITLTLDLWIRHPEPRAPIDSAAVKEAVSLERLAEGMELELEELFPKHSDLRLQAVRLLMLLEESGPRKQTELIDELGIERYEMSRLLTKLELHRYIVRHREGADKIVSLWKDRDAD